MATFAELDLDQPIIIVAHGGCPDGAVSALTLQRAVLTKNSKANTIIIESYHGAETLIDVDVPDGATLVFLDISPTLMDVPKLQNMKIVVVMDHHKSVADRMITISEQVAGLVNLSILDDVECGVSLVQRYVGEVYCLPDPVLQMAWKLDVFGHVLPVECEPFWDGFRGWVKMDGERKTSVNLMEKLVDDFDLSIAAGKKYFDEVIDDTHRIFSENQIMMYEVADFRLVFVNVPSDDQSKPMDFPTYQVLIDEQLSEPHRTTIVATINRVILGKKCWNLGLRRAGVSVDVGKLATALRMEQPELFPGGGGHPFAAGAQCLDPHVSLEELANAIVSVVPQTLVRKEI